MMHGSVKDLLDWWSKVKGENSGMIVWKLIPHAILWHIWKTRNELYFKGVNPKWWLVGDQIKCLVECWAKLNSKCKLLQGRQDV